MPSIEVNVDTYVDVEIDALEVIEECSNSEIRDILDYLEENNYIKGEMRIDPDASHAEVEFQTTIDKLSKLYLQITQEDLDVLEKIAKKY